MPRARRSGDRDLSRNAAYFLLFFGGTLGAIGGIFVLLIGAAVRWPELAASTPDWVYGVIVVVVLPGLTLGPWFLLDWLANRNPRLGSWVVAGLAAALVALGWTALAEPPLATAAWLTLAGGALLLLASYLTSRGGGTTALEWGTLRTSRVRAIEARLNPVVAVVVFVIGVGVPLVLWGAEASPLLLAAAVLAAIAGLGWLLWHRA